LHAAKGLEWSTVFITGAVEGLLPLVTEKGTADLEEERRLFYVGVTRASHRLVITWPRRRGWGPAPSSVSRFVADMSGRQTELVGRHVTDTASPSVLGVVRSDDPISPAACAVCGKGLVTGKERVLGRCLGCASLAHPAALAALWEWRRQASEETQRSNPAVLTNASLELVATKLPTTLAELASLPGLNTQKLSDFGQDLLEVVQPYSE
jgi:DNA helicase-2/ATP-dependent DNA helicase PcrA